MNRTLLEREYSLSGRNHRKSICIAACSSMALAAFLLTVTPADQAQGRGGTGSSAASPVANGGGGTTGGTTANTSGSGGSGGGKISPLTGVQSLRADTSAYVKDPVAAAQLGKALFWDIQTGSDGQACASCHFNGGADARRKNQVNPWGDEAAKSSPRFAAFSPRASDRTKPTGPNADLTAGDFPFKKYADPANRQSAVVYETNDRYGSSGTFAGEFALAGNPAGPTEEQCPQAYDPSANAFHKNGYVGRRVTGRNTPSNINAIFNYRQFWDGRANNAFNGVNPFGARDADARIWVERGNGKELVQILLQNASAASQATGPILSDGEMSCSNRGFGDVGRKLLPLTALGQQIVHPADSLFSLTPGLVNSSGSGLSRRYVDLIQQAFFDTYTKGGQAQLEANFSLFWGLAIMEYEALLISDQSPFDKGTLGKLEKDGQNIFEGKGHCASCHAGPLLTKAAVTTADGATPQVLDEVQLADGTTAIADKGFRNIGVRPTREDRGLGGDDPFGHDLSFSRQYILKQTGQTVPDTFNATGAPNQKLAGLTPAQLPRDNADGAFKIPGLRNVGMTAPYMHNGGQASLEQVVEFYNRGGDRQSLATGADTSGTADLPVLSPNGKPDRSNVDVNIKSSGLSLSAKDRAALVAFLKSLTDDRVACHAGPFDHPQLPLVMGTAEDVNASGNAGPANGRRATDVVAVLPATGKAGLPAESNSQGKLPCFPNSGNLFTTADVFGQVVAR